MQYPIKALYIEDQDTRYTAIWNLLKDSSRITVEMVRAHSGSEAVRLIGSEAFAACLVSVAAYQSEAFPLVKEALENQGVPYLLLMSDPDPEGELEVIRRGAADALRREELTPESLTRAIRFAVERYRGKRDTEEEYLRKYSYIMGDIVTVQNPDGTLRYVSPAVQQYLGYPPEELTGKAPFELIHPDDLPAVLERFKQETEQPAPYQPTHNDRITYRVRHRDGSWHVVESCGTILPCHNGESGVAVVTRDITQQIQNKEHMERPLSLAQNVHSAGTEGILVVDRQGKISDYNRAFLEMWNIPSEIVFTRDDRQTINYVLSQVKHPRRFVDKIEELYAQPEVVSYDIIEMNDGRFLERFSHPLFEGEKCSGRVWTFRDISEQSHTQSDLYGIFTSAKCILWFAAVRRSGEEIVWDLQIPDVEASQQVLPLDLEPGQSYARAWYRSRNPDDSRRLDEVSQDAIRKGLNGYSYEFRCTDKYGVERWLHEKVTLERVDDDTWRAVGVCIDITERKNAEESLRNIAAYARCILWSADVLMNERGLLEWRVKISDEAAAQRIVPLDVKPGGSYPQTWYDHRHPEDKEASDAYGRAAILSGKSSYSQEFRCFDRNGREHWLFEDVSLQQLETNRWHAVGVCTDITDRKRAEQSLHDVAAHVRCILWEADVTETEEGGLKWTVHLPDPEAAMKALPLDLKKGQSYSDAWYLSRLPEDRERSDAYGAASLRNGKKSYSQEYRCRDREGRLRYIYEDVSIESRGPGRWHCFGIGTDVTERKQSEESLKETHETLRTVVEASPLAIIAYDLGGCLTMWNPAAEEMFGWTADEAIGRPNPIVPQTGWASFRRLLHFLAEGEAFSNLEARRVRKDGSPAEVLVSLAPLRNAHGEVIGGMSILVDITERKRLEEAYRQTQKLESMGVLAGGIAHDFNNLLTVILGQASLALARLTEDDPSRAHIERSVEAASRAADLTRQLLVYTGKAETEKREVNLNELIRENARLLSTAHAKQVDLKLKLAKSLPKIFADAGQIQQVVMNLVINAAEAICDNGEITVTTETRTLAEKDLTRYFTGNVSLEPGRYATLRIKDSGAGMSKETLARIFDPFYTTKTKGRGLGLSATQGIIQAHGGGLKVESRPDSGTTFTVIFPALESSGAEDGAAESSSQSIRGTVLVVDDEELVREVTTDILEANGIRVLQATNGEEGVRAFQANSDEISLILLDMQMPVMTGKEALAKLRELDTRLPILLSSGHGEKETRATCGDLCDERVGFLQKPYSSDALLGAIRAALTPQEEG